MFSVCPPPELKRKSTANPTAKLKSFHTRLPEGHFRHGNVSKKHPGAPPEFLGKNRRLCLDLGNVQVMSQVKLSGEDLGILWNPPFRVDINAAVKPGENTLEIVVANVWANRSIGDVFLPAEKRITQGGVKLEQNARLAESGLRGPVRIAIGERAEVVFSQ